MAERKQGEATQGAEAGRAGKPQPDLTGRTLGDFHVLRKLGQGGMGQVYLAEQLSLKRKVALKLLKPELAANESALRRFQMEAEAVAKATHANIVQVYAISKADDLHYMALEYVEGRNLREYLEKKGPPELLLGLRIMAQVAQALQRAGELGIIHRDIKPENILLTRKGEVKVADFGLSRVFDEAGVPQNITQSGMTMGTPLYMSPEQVEAKPADPRSDIYSFGVTCYHMFAGRPPFRGKTALEVAYQHVHKEPDPLGEVRPDLPAELCTLIHKMMAKKAEERVQSGREVAREVGRLRDQLVSQGATPGQSVPALGLTMDGARSGSTQVMPVLRPRRWGWWLAGTACVALAGGAVIGWAHRPVGDDVIAPGAAIAAPPLLAATQDRERELRRRVEEHVHPESRLGVRAGLQDSVDLGLYYLHERRLAEAGKFFDEIVRRAPKVPAYRMLSTIGHAALLAFENKPAESNKEFLTLIERMDRLEKAERIFAPGGAALFKGNPELRKKLLAGLNKEEIEAYQLLWKENPQVRATVAEALYFNQRNASETFPAALEPYLHPPRHTTK